MKNIFKYMAFFVFIFVIGILTVSAKTDKFGNYITFPDEYDFSGTNNIMVNNITNSDLSYSWVKVSESSKQAIEQLFQICKTYTEMDPEDEGYEEAQSNCDAEKTTTTNLGLFPADRLTQSVNNGFTKVNLDDGTWIVWAMANDAANNYWSYKYYDIVIEQEEQTSEESTVPQNSNTNTTTKSNAGINPITGISTAIFIIVPLVLITGIYITIKKTKYE